MEAKAQADATAARPTALILSFVALVAFLDTFAIVPILSPYAVAQGASEAQAGWIVGLYSLANLMANLSSGVLIDRWGRRLPMALSLLSASVLIWLYGVLTAPLWLMAIRALHGATGAVFVPALFALTGEHGGSSRTRAMGRIGVLIGLTAMLAPPLSGMLVKAYGEPTLFVGVSVLTALAGLCAFWLPADAPSHEARTQVEWRALWRTAGVLVSFWLTLGMTFAMGVLTVALPLEMGSAGYDAAYRGRIWGAFALVSMLCMALVRRRGVLGGAFGRSVLGVALLMAGLIAFETLPMPTGAWLWALLGGVGFGLTFPAVHLLAFEHAPESARGSALAILHAFYSLGYVAGPALAGWLVAQSVAGWGGAIGAAAALLIALRYTGIIQKR
ncbi:MAG: MFS transporter [Fimbriimonadales bacterium]|jgi:MFS family permease|nr:MFS transporter [Fimbriimonadales bacterium]GBC89724.1 Inner membrane transport protein YajR [bacterium HR14]GIV11975.1 MAG: MFS transporter [Fimbriimonadales bacterium]CUU02310.1 Predicted arabinose efflux permease, MFS family [Armatimonadetes bacterium GBS]CUU34245.1 Predicted arabinose efflux permease, MFS family [Armatimonadetes bacterium GXS]